MKKIVLQHDENDCGAACLSMIAAGYRYYNELNFFKDVTKTDRDGTNIFGIVDGAKKIGLVADALEGDLEELLKGIQDGEISFPFIAHIINDEVVLHYVVVDDIRQDKILVRDPAKGQIFINIEDFVNQWTGHIVSFSKSEEFKEENDKRNVLQDAFRLIIVDYKRFIGIVLLSIVISTIGIMCSFVFEIIIDNYTERIEAEAGYIHEHEEIDSDSYFLTANDSIIENGLEWVSDSLINLKKTFSSKRTDIIFISVIVLYIISCLIQFARGKILILFQKKVDLELGGKYMQHILKLPISKLENYKTGEYLSRFSDMESIRYAISSATTTIILDSIMIVGCGIVLFLAEKHLFCISLGFVSIYILVAIVYKKPLNSTNRRVMEANAITQSFLKERIDGIQMIKSFCAEKNVYHSFDERYSKQIKAIVRNNEVSLSQEVICIFLEMMCEITILWYGYYLVLEGKMTLGALITFFYLKVFFTEPIKNIICLQPTVRTAFIALERLKDIMDMEYENKISGKDLERIEKIEVKNVSFRYGNRDLVLDNISFSIDKGERVAIVGQSGSGKTTIAKLLLRYYELDDGKININGNNYLDYDLHKIREKITYVDQNTYLFSDTIAENLRLGNPNATQEELERICRLCEINDYIQSLPNGYETVLYENGLDMSGGLRQRLSIARALLRHPDVLILDEATSNLDLITEETIRKAIMNYDINMTCIIIAHRLKTIKQCDKILVVDEKHIIESGTHQELIENHGKYYELWEMQ